jgi:diketogulonate reductase-like aldo/keto reductase
LSDAEHDSNGKVIPIDVPHIVTWRVLEEHYNAGVLKSIGISNFNAKQIRHLYEKAKTKPMNLQIELHILCPQNELLALCGELNVSFSITLEKSKLYTSRSQ